MTKNPDKKIKKLTTKYYMAILKIIIEDIHKVDDIPIDELKELLEDGNEKLKNIKGLKS